MPPGGSTRADGWWPWLFVLPTVIGVLTFYIWPIVKTGYLSFTETGPFGGATWAGTENYAELVSDEHVWLAVGNTVVYTAIVLLGIPIALGLASLVNRPGLRCARLFRVLFFMPYIAMPTAIALVWRIIYNGDFGILNWFLGLFGIDGPYWTSTPGFAIVAVGVVGLWSSLGFGLIIFSAGLQGISTEYYEAAQLDGATRWIQFRKITVPLLTPSIFFVTVISVINGFQLFDLLYAIMGNANPATARSQSLVYIFYNQAFIQQNQGYAAAIAMLILVVIGVVTWFQFRLQRRWVNYV
ncbi:carbohydrate ABC transporter membrane protein 1, CUT1 family [Jiangella alba]|uniref:Carbohydrate ABC transporter membrane protein 1, CUT1 family n=1 Tax=Jiangella alba TaxID=561176 RepID=A0A1H5JB99_9ACTN|nr:carbohydrate ABC transporter membrane protein 1, CUT1 family [Jiangella alba]